MRITIERQNRHRLNKKLLSRTPNMGVILPKLFLFYNWSNILIKGQGFAVLCALDSQYIWYLKFGIDQALNNSKHRAMKFKVRQSIFYYPQLELSLLLLYYMSVTPELLYLMSVFLNYLEMFCLVLFLQGTWDLLLSFSNTIIYFIVAAVHPLYY